MPCRIHIKDAAGKPQRAGDLPFWFDHFVSPGTATLQLKPGKYTIEIERGPEFVRIADAFEVKDKEDTKFAYELSRLIDLSAEGWWSGDLHVHRPVDAMELLMRAEDLRVAPVITEIMIEPTLPQNWLEARLVIVLRCPSHFACSVTFTKGENVMAFRTLLKADKHCMATALLMMFTVLVAPAPGQDPFTLKISRNTPIYELLPVRPKSAGMVPLLANEDLNSIPEVMLAEPISRQQSRQNALKQTAHLIAKINHLNNKNSDGFLHALRPRRSDLNGLPFLMGQDCRTDERESAVFAAIANATHAAVADGTSPVLKQFWADAARQRLFTQTTTEEKRQFITKVTTSMVNARTVAALMQILAPESESLRVSLANFLTGVRSAESARALAKLALFAPEEKVQTAAIEGLKRHRHQDYTDILLRGFQYPLPAVAKRAAQALVKLERKDLLINLINVLQEPDPRLPVRYVIDDDEVFVVREVVRINHHQNCLLCHEPGNTADVPRGVLRVPVPLSTEPLPSPQVYYRDTPPSPDIVVRIDRTYLRQDFSLMLKVADAKPWPEMQRFDFLVRTRELTPDALQAMQAQIRQSKPGELPPNQAAALFALRKLTQRDTEPTRQAWWRLVKSLESQQRP